MSWAGTSRLKKVYPGYPCALGGERFCRAGPQVRRGAVDFLRPSIFL
jgi:hypothetical protein